MGTYVGIDCLRVSRRSSSSYARESTPLTPSRVAANIPATRKAKKKHRGIPNEPEQRRGRGTYIRCNTVRDWDHQAGLRILVGAVFRGIKNNSRRVMIHD